MKNVTEIIDEINEINVALLTDSKRKKGDVEKLKASQKSKFKKRKAYLTVCWEYLKTNPTPEFIQKEKDRLTNRNNKIMEGMPKGVGATTQMKRDYEKLMNLPHIRLQLRTLQFIS